MGSILRQRATPLRTNPSTPFSSHRIAGSRDGISFPYANSLSVDAKSYRYDSNEWGFAGRSKFHLWTKKIIFGVGMVILAWPWVNSIKLYWRIRSIENEMTLLQDSQLLLQDDIRKQTANLKKFKRDSEAQKEQNGKLLQVLKEKGESFDEFDSDFYIEAEGKEEKYFQRMDELSTEVQRISLRSLTQRGYDFEESDAIRVVMTLEKEIGNAGKNIVMELGPINKIPHAIDLFTTLVERKQFYDGLTLMLRNTENKVIHTVPINKASVFDNGAGRRGQIITKFKPSRNEEILQREDQLLLQQLAMSKIDKEGMPIEKYSVVFSDHGPHFYIVMEDNFIVNEVNKQETCFAKVVEGQEILDFIMGYNKSGNSRDIYYIGIESMKIIRPNSRGAFGSPNDISSISFQTKWTASIKVPAA